MALEGSDQSELSLFEHLAKIEIGNKQVTELQNTDVAPRVNLTHRDPNQNLESYQFPALAKSSILPCIHHIRLVIHFHPVEDGDGVQCPIRVRWDELNS